MKRSEYYQNITPDTVILKMVIKTWCVARITYFG